MHSDEPIFIIERCEQHLLSYSYGMNINKRTDQFRFILKKFYLLLASVAK